MYDTVFISTYVQLSENTEKRAKLRADSCRWHGGGQGTTRELLARGALSFVRARAVRATKGRSRERV